MITETPQTHVEDRRTGRQYEVVVIVDGPNQHRHYFDYAEALADFREAVAAEEEANVRLYRIDGGELKLIGAKRFKCDPVGDVMPPEADPKEVPHIKVVVACTNANGEPDFTFCVVKHRQEQYDEGDHYDAAINQACENGYEGDMVCYDQNDGPAWLFEHFEWTSIGEPHDITGEELEFIDDDDDDIEDD